MTRYSIIAITTVCVVLSACASATVQPDADGRVHGTVISVADGDTVTVKFASGQHLWAWITKCILLERESIPLV
jgi:endonuclease YncB( thermonuclease family)